MDLFIKTVSLIGCERKFNTNLFIYSLIDSFTSKYISMDCHEKRSFSRNDSTRYAKSLRGATTKISDEAIHQKKEREYKSREFSQA